MFAWIGTFIGVTVPFLGVIAAAVLFWDHGCGWLDLGLMVGMYLASMVGITVGFHRLFTHRAFQTVAPIQYLLAALGSMAFQGPLIDWVGRHRIHHQFSDDHGDPHSPHLHKGGFWNAILGFWHAHIGWAFSPMEPGMERYAGDIRRNPVLRTISDLFPLWAILGLLIPAAIGLAVNGWYGALTGFIWGGLVRVFMGHHVTWSVNSVCHVWGERPYDSGDKSRNNLVVGVLALGEGWHNNHHAFPSSARHGLRWWQVDLSWYIIRAMEKCGLAWKVRLPSEEEMATRRHQPENITGDSLAKEEAKEVQKEESAGAGPAA